MVRKKHFIEKRKNQDSHRQRATSVLCKKAKTPYFLASGSWGFPAQCCGLGCVFTLSQLGLAPLGPSVWSQLWSRG